MNAQRLVSYKLGMVFKCLMVLAASVLLSACGGGGGDEGGGINLVNRLAETIVYVASDSIPTNGDNELYAVDDDDQNQRMLSAATTENNSDIQDFAVSPDGQWVAYLSDVVGFEVDALFVVPIDGSSAPQQVSRVVNPNPGTVINRSVKDFTWSPDSTQLAYTANFDGSLSSGSFFANEVFLVDRNGGNEIKISGAIGSPAVVEVKNPQWSPDGHYIVQEVFQFSSGSTSPAAFALNIYDTTLGTPNSTRLTTANTDIRNVRWSPSSTRLAYRGDLLQTGRYDIYIVPVNGTQSLAQPNAGFNADMRWAPDGSEIAYLNTPPTASNDLLANPRVNGQQRTLVSTSANGRTVFDYRWSPDGSSIAYTSDEATAGKRELYVIPASGGTATQVSGSVIDTGDVFEFEWSPTGDHIAYVADQEADTVIDVFVSNVDGSANTKLNAGLSGTEAVNFDWSGDGSHVAFNVGATATTTSPDQLYVNTVDGNNLRQVSDVTLNAIELFSYSK